jgi:hypothetical protein
VRTLRTIRFPSWYVTLKSVCSTKWAKLRSSKRLEPVANKIEDNRLFFTHMKTLLQQAYQENKVAFDKIEDEFDTSTLEARALIYSL